MYLSVSSLLEQLNGSNRVTPYGVEALRTRARATPRNGNEAQWNLIVVIVYLLMYFIHLI
jgi:hypothetical protein